MSNTAHFNKERVEAVTRHLQQVIEKLRDETKKFQGSMENAYEVSNLPWVGQVSEMLSKLSTSYTSTAGHFETIFRSINEVEESLRAGVGGNL